MSDFDKSKSGMKEKPFPISDAIAGFIITIVTLLLAVVCILGYNFLTKTIGLETKELLLWLIFMLIAAAISCFSDTIISLASKKSKEDRERSMVQEITSAVMMKQTGLVSGEQGDIFIRLMNQCLETKKKIERIRIFAYKSNSFSKDLTDYFKDTPFECNELEIMVHSPEMNKKHPIIDEWMQLFNAKDIEVLRIKKIKEFDRRFIFGMIVEFGQGHHNRMGMVGFYKLKDEDNSITTFNKRYGVLNEENSILEILDEYFNRYFDSDSVTILREAYKNEKRFD